MIILLCVLLTAILVFFVFSTDPNLVTGEEKTRLGYLYERKDVVYENLRDLNFEYKAGKFPEGDFEAMRSTLEAEAGEILAEIESLENPSPSPDPAPSKRKGARS